MPAHFLKKHHPYFTPGKTWDDFRDANRRFGAHSLPQIAPWVPIEFDETKGCLYERTPYYAVVGRQPTSLYRLRPGPRH